MMRLCPKCETERDISEVFCEGTIDGKICSWSLSDIPVRPNGWRPTIAAEPIAIVPQTARVCPNGHPAEAGDLLCETCGEDIDSPPVERVEATQAITETEVATTISGWRLDRRVDSGSSVRERYIAIRESDGHEALLTLYAEGREPDTEVYEVLRTLSYDHVPEILETGRWRDRAFEVSEDLRGGTLADLGLLPNDLPTLSSIVFEVGKALHAFAECGLRHRDLRPGSVMVRTRHPLDIVITSFGSARLSEFDLDIVSPLETTRYTAPEAVAGGVAAASDWWSLGMLLLEQVTRGACFEGVNDQAFLIHVLTNGAPIPEGLDPSVDLLLRGLLALDRRERWGWGEVTRWLAGDFPEAPSSSRGKSETDNRFKLSLGGKQYGSSTSLALAAGKSENWEEVRSLFLRGALLTWMEEAELDAKMRNEVRRYAELDGASEDIRLALALKTLNPAMPLVCRGEIVTPNWLLDHPDAGYELIAGPGPAILEAKETELWLAQMRRRADRVRDRARQLGITLDEDLLRVHLLSSSRSRLAAVWADRRRILPDTDHPGLLALLERKQSEDDDYILLLGADAGQFRSSDAIVEEAADTASRAGVRAFDREIAAGWLDRSRRELYAAIEGRTEGFARCGLERVDEWAGQFRLERRLPLSRALVLLAVPREEWVEPPKQSYVATLLEFFSKRITGAVMRGPLTRMVIGKTTARVDLAELNSARQPAAAILDHLLLRNGVPIDIDPGALMADPKVERRVRLLYSHATLYRRDTGIDGLYMGFPFLLMQEAKATTKPRIAPILLWPLRLRPEVGSRGRISVEFDRDREEVRLNPAFETLLGTDAARRWREAADEILGRSSVTAAEVVDAFAALAEVTSRQLRSLPGKETRVKVGDDQVACAAALFHLAYLGQAVMEDLRQLKSIPPAGSSLETVLRVGEVPLRETAKRAPEIERFFTAASDPSQEAAVMEARAGRGLVVEGPPGTGKSQTIVNMVADAIGRQKSLLVVCQKQSALEVVHKRLEAEGLGNRIVMINDVNKDRKPTIQAVRDQLDALTSRAFGASVWRQQRQQLAARIEALESDLDGQHRALHDVDEQTGMSYRTILGDLIGYTEAANISLPGLRQALAALNPNEVAGLQEVCAPLARLWLPAQYEDSALADVEPFAPDEATVATFTGDLAAFEEAEKARAGAIERTPHAISIRDPEPYRLWASAHGAALLELPADDRARLARWLPMLMPGEARRIDQLLSELETLRAKLSAIGLGETDEPARSVVLALAGAELDQWCGRADDLAQDPGLLGRLSIARWLRRRKLATFLREVGIADERTFRTALHREIEFRPLREKLASIMSDLGNPATELGGRTAIDLQKLATEMIAQIAVVDGHVDRLTAYPTAPTAYAMAREGTRSAVVDLLDGLEQAFARVAARAVSTSKLGHLEHWISASWRLASASDIERDVVTGARTKPMLNALDTLPAYQRFRARVPQLDERAMNAFRILRTVRDRLIAIEPSRLDQCVRTIIARESRLAWKARLEATSPALLFEASELQGRAEALAEADVEMRRLNRRFLVDGFDATLLRPRQWEDITRLTGPRSKRLREFLEKGVDLGLMTLRPVWLVNPDVASRLLPLTKGLFDAVIYDEASQMPIEYALPTLFRSKTMVVSGDEKQMPPTAFFSSKVESDEAEVYEGDDEPENAEEREEAAETWNRREIKDCPDLLQLAKTVVPSTTLQIHYRSAYRELIQFSNASFYRNELSVPARHPAGEVRRVRPIEVVRVDGLYENQTNPTEAARVVDVLADLWKTRPRKTIGVVTFNRKQADLIDDVLEERAERDVAFRQALTEERDRVEGGEDMGFFVKNVENVQGDERDIIIFSSTFGRNAQGTFRRSFGVLGQVGGERRLNVAVTRAREKVILVTSMPVAEISDLLTTRRQAATPRDYLQAYFEYARALSAGELENAGNLLHRLLPERQERRFQPEQYRDGFQIAVAAAIRELGWEPTEVGEGGAFGLDFAIEDPRTGLYGIGIECDAPRHPLLETARAREMWRPNVLARSIPVVHRVSSHRWYHEREIEKQLLKRAIEAALTQEKAA